MNSNLVSYRSNGRPISGHGNGVSVTSLSSGKGWQGVHLATGWSRGWAAEGMLIDGHYLAMNLGKTLEIETLRNGEWISVSMPSGSLWINPEGRPFFMRHRTEAHFAVFLIEGKFLDSVLGTHYELRSIDGISDPLLSSLMQSLIAVAGARQEKSRELGEMLVRSLGFALATRHGSPSPVRLARGGIAPKQLKALCSWLQQHLADSLTIKAMASQVGLSPAHFSREFKRSTGLTPWRYLVEIRLNAAHRLIEAGTPISAVAYQTGFYDQFHLSRLFKKQFGLSPSELKCVRH